MPPILQYTQRSPSTTAERFSNNNMHLAALRAPRLVETAIMGVDLWDKMSRACDERGMSSQTLLFVATVCLCTGSRSILSSKRPFFCAHPRFIVIYRRPLPTG